MADLREEIAKTLDYNCVGCMPKGMSCIHPCEYQYDYADRILSLIIKEVEGIDNPNRDCYNGNDPETQNVNEIAEDVWNEAIQAVIGRLKDENQAEKD